MKKFKTFTPDETRMLGRELGQMAGRGDVICLNGDLGTGKTAFTNGIAEGMGIKGYITSPTFTIVNEYKAMIPLYHFDVYRVADSDEMFDIGFEEYIEGDGVVVIEWADLIRDILPGEHIQVDIGKDMDNLGTRIITIEFIGDRYRKYEDQLTIGQV